jgi:uncharacterized repeat protein (TIGR03837 family)
MSAPLRWDIFCKVIDNFGDAGVCWRLARQLATEQGAKVRLWIDRPETLDALRAGLSVEGVEVRSWDEATRLADPGEVIVEAFGAPVPESWLAAMAGSERPPVWINLEYLSAEDWVEGCHGLPSPHPRLPLTQWFFYPGFTERTGGLLRETDLLARRDRFRAEDGATALWRKLGIAAPPEAALNVSLFAYETDGLAGLLDAWAAADRPVWCAVPEGRVSQQVREWAGARLLPGDAPFRRGALTLQSLPFVSQDDYDALLWACDLNFVRGEDSFVRAQWAARPFIWQIYRQDEDTHIEKLDAFLGRYTAGLAEADAAALRAFHAEWNPSLQHTIPDPGKAWPALASSLPELCIRAMAWCEDEALRTPLASALAEFAKSKLK